MFQSMANKVFLSTNEQLTNGFRSRSGTRDGDVFRVPAIVFSPRKPGAFQKVVLSSITTDFVEPDGTFALAEHFLLDHLGGTFQPHHPT